MHANQRLGVGKSFVNPFCQVEGRSVVQIVGKSLRSLGLRVGLVGMASVGTALAALPASLENPSNGAKVSGIGLVSGWACDAANVEVSFNGGARTRVPSGGSRADTASVCGRSDTGFGLTYNYNLLGNGTHTAQLYVGGVAAGNPASFTVTVPAGEFIRGQTKTVSVPDFPTSGSVTQLEWQESSQNFVISSVTKPSKVECTPPNIPYPSGDACRKPTFALISGPLGEYWAFVDTGLVIPNPNVGSGRLLNHAAMADVNGDGIQDVLIAGSELRANSSSPLRAEDFLSTKAIVLLGGEQLKSGESLFEEESLKHNAGTDVVIGDFNGDGRQDIFIAACGPDVPNPPGTQSKAAVSSGTRYISAPMDPQVSFLHSASGGRAGGFPVVYAGALWGEKKIPFLYVYRDGAFKVDRTMLPQLVTATKTDPWAPTVERPLRAFTASKVGDVTGDGVDDLVLGIEGLSSHLTDIGPAIGNYLVVGTSQGWANGQVIKLPAPTFLEMSDVTVLDIELADLSRSGRNDIILTYTNKYETRGIQILRNKGNGVFEDVSQEMLGASAYLNEWTEAAIRIVDINGDGCLDMVLPFLKGKSDTKRYGEVFLNDCRGAFVDATTVFSAAMADLKARLPKGLIFSGGQFLIPIMDYTRRVSFYIPLQDDVPSSGGNSIRFYKLDNLKNMPTPANRAVVY